MQLFFKFNQDFSLKASVTLFIFCIFHVNLFCFMKFGTTEIFIRKKHTPNSSMVAPNLLTSVTLDAFNSRFMFIIFIVSSNPVHGEVYSLQHYVIKFVSDLRQVGGFLRVLRFPPPIKLTPRYNWDNVESGVQHHKPTVN
jgi:hypothetical protein